MLSITLIFLATTTSYKEAKADALSMSLAAAGATAGGLTVGGVLAVSLGIVAVGYGCYLVVDNWEEITTACGDFLSKATGAVKDWWDSICGSAVKVDEPTVPLPEKLGTGEVINFFDYYLPSSGGSGGDPNNGDKMELDPQVLGALYSFLLTYYGLEALDPDEVLSNEALSSMSIQQLAEYIDYQPAAEELINAYNKSVAGINGYQSLKDLGILYVLLTPRKPIEMYVANDPVYGVLDVPDLSDTIFVGVKDDGSAAIFSMGFTGNAVINSSGGNQKANNNQYTYPYYPTSGIDLLNEPFMSTLHCNYDAAYFYRTNNNGVYGNAWTGGASGQQWVKAIYSEIYKYSQQATTFNMDNIGMTDLSDPSGKSYSIPFSAFYTHYDRGNSLTQQYYYIWDNVQYNDGSLIMGDYNVNFVGGRDYFNFYTYDYEHWLANKAYYAQCFKNLTKAKGRIETYANTTFEKFIPGETYTIPKSNYKVVIPEGESVHVDINEYLLQELAKINTLIDNNFDRVIKAINDANKKSATERGKATIDKIIIDNTDPTPGGDVNVDLSETNALIENLPSAMAEAVNVPGALSDAFTPSGDFTNLNNFKTNFGDFFNFQILYEYHEMIETFLSNRVGNNSPPVFYMYPKQSGLVYFKDMPNQVPVIDFSFMETEIFTWGITIRYFVRCLLTFFVLGVWLNRTIKKLPGVVSGL